MPTLSIFAFSLLLVVSGVFGQAEDSINVCDKVCEIINQQNRDNLPSFNAWYPVFNTIYPLQLMDGVRMYWLKMGNAYHGKEYRQMFDHHWRVYILPSNFYAQYDDDHLSKFINEETFWNYETFFQTHNIGGVLLDMVVGDEFRKKVAREPRDASFISFATVLYVNLGHDTLFHKAGSWLLRRNEERMSKAQMHNIFNALVPIFQRLGIEELRASDDGTLECTYHAQEQTMAGVVVAGIKTRLSGGILGGADKFSYKIGQSVLRIFDPEHFDDPYFEFGFQPPDDGKYTEVDTRARPPKQTEGKTITPLQMKTYENIFTTRHDAGKSKAQLEKGQVTWGSLCKKLKEKGFPIKKIEELTTAVLESIPDIPPPPEDSKTPALSKAGTTVRKFGRTAALGTGAVVGTATRVTKNILTLPVHFAPKFVRKGERRAEVAIENLATKNVVALGLTNLLSWTETNVYDKKLPAVIKRLWYSGERGCRNLEQVLEAIRFTNVYPGLKKLIDVRQHLRIKVPPRPNMDRNANDVRYGEYIYDHGDDMNVEHKFENWKPAHEEGSEWTMTMITVMGGLVVLTVCCLFGLLFGMLCGCMGAKWYMSHWLMWMKNGHDHDDDRDEHESDDEDENDEADQIVDVD